MSTLAAFFIWDGNFWFGVLIGAAGIGAASWFGYVRLKRKQRSN